VFLIHSLFDFDPASRVTGLPNRSQHPNSGLDMGNEPSISITFGGDYITKLMRLDQ
jgi:hypothetical protein